MDGIDLREAFNAVRTADITLHTADGDIVFHFDGIIRGGVSCEIFCGHRTDTMGRSDACFRLDYDTMQIALPPTLLPQDQGTTVSCEIQSDPSEGEMAEDPSPINNFLELFSITLPEGE